MEVFGCPAVLAFEYVAHEGGFIKVHVALFFGHFAEVAGELCAKTADAGADEGSVGAVYGEDVEGKACAFVRFFYGYLLGVLVHFDVIGCIALHFAEFGGEEDYALVHEESYGAVAGQDQVAFAFGHVGKAAGEYGNVVFGVVEEESLFASGIGEGVWLACLKYSHCIYLLFQHILFYFTILGAFRAVFRRSNTKNLLNVYFTGVDVLSKWDKMTLLNAAAV